MTIQPRLGAGIRDYLPKDMIPRQKMLDTIRKTFELFGFVPLDTPGLEVEEVLTGSDPNFRMNIFKAGLRNSEDQSLALRFDLTVPLARVVAQYDNALEKPFKRYQVGKVWRGEKPQAGRFREFVQFDADIVGSSRLSADAEIIALMCATMKALGFENFLVRINNRKILNGLSQFIGFTVDKTPEVLRIIDKLDKIKWKGVAKELASDEVGFSEQQLELLKRFLDLMDVDQDSLLGNLQELMENSSIALEGIAELKEIQENVEALGVPKSKFAIDLSVARGLGYYTGPVFETVLTDLLSIGSVFSGGRYDDLVARFGSSEVPAVGASVGVDRLFAAMEKLGIVQQEKTVAKVLILNFDKNAERKCQEIVSNVRASNIPAEIYLGRETTLRGQLAYAVRQEFLAVIIVGQSELDGGVAQVKNMGARNQLAVKFDEVTSVVKGIIEV